MSIATPPSPIPADPNAIPDRKDLEREFHNRRERDRQQDAASFLDRYPNKKFYALARSSKAFMNRWMARHAPGSRALAYCCGLGQDAIELARLGAKDVVGIDISDVSIETARREAEAAGVADRTRFLVMDAERTSFPDDSFDVIVVNGCLHHLDLAAAFAELRRILTPNGRIICTEALAHNPIVMAYRRRTPHLRTAFEVDHILRVEDIRRALESFDRVDIRFFHLASIAALPLRTTRLFSPALAVLDAVDGAILRIPGLRRWAWQAIFELSGPKGKDAVA
ncbi:class I SAM-dependent methyltransferase [Tautonia sociabilis]|uniref:Class I SAM-dependent methyltransferase n=1 Tax=Tautonia sociabilis TaxID=2080755 RepID=A0A432MIF5_9BACT|nr:class I SAM-dependent methyltransferase [Tautonia sociabilis]RUL87079.1 class I SAM-dependent methyltransferase [Tautonia sociabilis]